MPRNCGCETINNPDCTTTETGITTPECSGNIVCKEYIWSNCIKYGGVDLSCAVISGGVSTFSYSGAAEDSGTYTVTGLTATGGSGTGAIFTVAASGSTVYTVTRTTAGTGYRVGDTLTIAGEDIQVSFTSASDVTIVITGLSNTVTTTAVQIETDDTLNSIIENLNSRICELTPDFQDYSSFDYSCLRVGGNLESTGTAITNAKQFVEATADALCALNTRLKDVEVPGITSTGVSTLDGTETLPEALQEIADAIGDLADVFALPITATASCFTTAPISTDPISDWFQWVIDNVCSIRSTINTNVSTQTTRVDNINTYLRGSTSPSYPQTYDISALGGSATANVHQVLGELITEVTALDTAVAALPDLDAITLTWASCFSGSPYTYTSDPQDLQTHLERILNVISREKITFSSDFTVTDSSCGKTVELAAGVGVFTCADLGTCSITDLGDVDATAPGSGDTGKVYKWNNSSSKFELVSLDLFTNIGVVDKSGSYSGASLGFYFQAASVTAPAQKEYKIGFVEKSWTPVASFQPNYTTTVSDPLSVKMTWDGHILFKGILGSVSSPSSSAFNVPGGTSLFTIPTGFFPTVTASKIDMSVTYTAVSPSDTPITLSGYCLINGGTGSVTFYCNDGDGTATAAAITALGNNDAHEFLFTGKAIYQ